MRSHSLGMALVTVTAVGCFRPTVVRVEPSGVRVNGRIISSEQEIYDTIRARRPNDRSTVLDVTSDATLGAVASAINGSLAGTSDVEVRVDGRRADFAIGRRRARHTLVFVKIDSAGATVRWQTDRPCSVAPTEELIPLAELAPRLSDAARRACGGVACIERVDVLSTDAALPFRVVATALPALAAFSTSLPVPVTLRTTKVRAGSLYTWRGIDFDPAALGEAPEWRSMCGVPLVGGELKVATAAAMCFAKDPAHAPNVVEWMPVAVTLESTGGVRVRAADALPTLRPLELCAGVVARRSREPAVLECLSARLSVIQADTFAGYDEVQGLYMTSRPLHRTSEDCLEPAQ